ncbi:MAG: membrane protein, partial [Candidatus Omnitrophota bacterium]
LRASALTFFSLLSIVPVVAMAFGIAKGFGFENLLEEKLLVSFTGQEEVIAQVVGFARNMLDNTQGGLIAGVGVGVLFWTVIKVIGQIESSFNDIWGIAQARTIGRKFSDYLSIILICPMLLIVSSSVTVLIASQITMIVDKLSFLGPVGDLVIGSLKILPYMVIWAVFSFLYIFLPNTRVMIKSGILGGIIAGTAYQVWQIIYLSFQLGAAKYGAIYGSFAALPLFLMWLQVSWFIVLFGAEISFAEQNVETYEFEPDCLSASHHFKRLIALNIVQLCVKNFHLAQNPWTASDIAHKVEMPIRLVRQILFELTQANILNQVKTEDDKTQAYQPARDIEQLTVQEVVEKLDHYGMDELALVESKELKEIRNTLKNFSEKLKNSSTNLLLKNI